MGKLFMMDFPTEQVRIENRYRDEEILSEIRRDTPDIRTIAKIQEVYGELLFPPAPEDRPYTFCSVVLSSDGKMAFHDRTAGPLIAKQNFFDPDGALADFWMLNALRVYSDGVILGAMTLQNEAHNTSHIFDREMAAQRRSQLHREKHPVNIVVSFDATDIPFDHIIFDVDRDQDFRVAIATSPAGMEEIRDQCSRPYRFYGPYTGKEEVRVDRLAVALDKDREHIPVIITGENDCPDSDLLLWILRRIGMERLLIESPSYNWHLMQKEELDEFFINYSMVFAGGAITPGVSAPFDHDSHPHARLLAMGTHASSFIFTRQKLYYGVKKQEDLSRYRY